MSNILARSPYIVEVNETGQDGSKIEIFLWNGTGSAPTTAQYTLSKLIPASNNTQTVYDIAPYIREYITFTQKQSPYIIITGVYLDSQTGRNVYVASKISDMS